MVTASFTLAVHVECVKWLSQHGPMLGSGSRESIQVKMQNLVNGKLKHNYFTYTLTFCSFLAALIMMSAVHPLKRAGFNHSLIIILQWFYVTSHVVAIFILSSR